VLSAVPSNQKRLRRASGARDASPECVLPLTYSADRPALEALRRRTHPLLRSPALRALRR
jgi:hypothetical protein